MNIMNKINVNSNDETDNNLQLNNNDKISKNNDKFFYDNNQNKSSLTDYRKQNKKYDPIVTIEKNQIDLKIDQRNIQNLNNPKEDYIVSN